VNSAGTPASVSRQMNKKPMDSWPNITQRRYVETAMKNLNG